MANVSAINRGTMRKQSVWPWTFGGAFLGVLAMSAPAMAADAGEPPPPGLLDINFASAIWVLISFVLLVIILKKAAWQNVLDSLKGREDRIRNDIRAGEEARAKAETLLKEHAAQVAG